MTINVANLDAGDTKFEYGRTVTLESDGTVSPGDPVVFDSNGLVTGAAAGDVPVGVVENSDMGGDDYYGVHVAGLGVVVEGDGAVAAGDRLTANGSGQFQTAGTPEEGMPIALGDSTAAGDPLVALFR